jgi:hypothetical protein
MPNSDRNAASLAPLTDLSKSIELVLSVWQWTILQTKLHGDQAGFDCDNFLSFTNGLSLFFLLHLYLPHLPKSPQVSFQIATRNRHDHANSVLSSLLIHRENASWLLVRLLLVYWNYLLWINV